MDDEERWRAVMQRDPRYADAFIYGVKTTGVACRPACASRTPRRENVEFFASVALAIKAGYRPCKRCHAPSVPSAATRALVEACRRLEASDESVRAQDVASALGMTPSAFTRAFRRALGVTPQQYRRGILAARAKAALARGASVTEAIYSSGYASSSRFYEGAARELGMEPSVAREGGQGLTVRYALGDSKLGRVAVAWTEHGVCDVLFVDDENALRAHLGERFANAAHAPAATPPWFADVIAAAEGSPIAHVPLDIQGTAFQARVWTALRKIPYGQTRTYQEVATALGMPKAHRAVARAIAQNRIACLVPCHRVVGKSGSLTGYRWGIARKRALLALEALSKDEAELASSPANGGD